MSGISVLRSSCLVAAMAALLVSSSSCTLTQLKESNRRLKEANERLVSRYNQLEQDVAELERQLQSRDEEIARLRDRGDSAPKTAIVTASMSATKEFTDMGLEAEKTDEGTVVRLDHAVFFPLGKATLSSEGKRILSQVSRILNTRHAGKLIRVEGHTDDTPIRKVRNLYPTNWELSTARACSVVRYLVESGNVSPHRVYPAGFAYYRPREAGSSARSKSRNRRVEILILDESA